MQTAITKENLIRLRGVIKRTGLCKSAIYKKARDGSFPSPMKIGLRSSAWRETEIDAWIAAQIARVRNSS